MDGASTLLRLATRSPSKGGLQRTDPTSQTCGPQRSSMGRRCSARLQEETADESAVFCRHRAGSGVILAGTDALTAKTSEPCRRLARSLHAKSRRRPRAATSVYPIWRRALEDRRYGQGSDRHVPSAGTVSSADISLSVHHRSAGEHDCAPLRIPDDLEGNLHGRTKTSS